MSFWKDTGEVVSTGGPAAVCPEGDHIGRVAKVTPGKTAAGHRVIKLRLALTGGYTVFHDLNVDHPGCKKVTNDTITIAMRSAYKDPPRDISSYEEGCRVFAGIPIAVHIKHKGLDEKGRMRYGVYFNDKVDPIDKISFAQAANDY